MLNDLLQLLQERRSMLLQLAAEYLECLQQQVALLLAEADHLELEIGGSQPDIGCGLQALSEGFGRTERELEELVAGQLDVKVLEVMHPRPANMDKLIRHNTLVYHTTIPP